MAGPDEQTTPWQLFRRTARAAPNDPAIVDERRDERLTYEELHDHAVGFANGLADRGIGRGDTYATIAKNGLELTSAALASTAIGGVVNTVNYRQSPDAIRHILDDSEARAVVFDADNSETVAAIKDDVETVETFVFAGDGGPSWAEPYDDVVADGAGRPLREPDLDPSDPFYLVYTSGTTGAPKGCLYTVGRYVETLFQVMHEFRMADERLLLVAPQAHAAGGLGGGTVPLFQGGTIVTAPAFHPVRALESIERESITHVVAVPAMLRAMVAAGPERFDVESLRTIVSFGSPFPSDLARDVVDAFDPDYLGNNLGATEAAWVATRNVLDDLDAAPSPGTAALNVEIRVVRLDEDGEASDPDDVCEPGDTGELIVRSPYGMDRYLNRPEATESAFRDGWYYTGDIGYLDERGRFWPEGRAANVIVSGGVNVAPANVERVLREHPAVADVAVVGVPDERWGEKVVAYVVPAEGASDDPDAILEWCRDRSDLATFQRPKSIEFVEEFPRSATMKVQKFELAERAVGGD